MTLEELRRLADALGIADSGHMDVSMLIRLIQFEEGQLPCFSEAWSAPCNVDDCSFSKLCSSNLLIRTKARH